MATLPSVALIFIIILATHIYGGSYTYEFITTGGPYSQRAWQRFSLSFQHTALPHITPVNADIVQQEQYYYSQYIIVGCCPWSAILIVYSVNYCKITFC